MLPLLLTLTAAYAILSWRDLHKAFLLLVAVLPSYLLRTEIFGVPTTLLELLVVTFLVVWFLKRRISPLPKAVRDSEEPSDSRRREPREVTVAIGFLLLASTISVFIAPNLVDALGVWKAYFLEPILLFFVIRHELTQTDAPNAKTSYDAFMSSKIFQALGVSAIILSMVAIYQWLTGTGIPIPWDIERRVTSVFDYPNALGLFLGPIVVIAFLWVQKTDRVSWFWLTTVVLSFVAIVLAQSEAAIVSILAVLGIVGIIHTKTRIPTTVGILVLILSIGLSPWRGAVIDKLTLRDYSGQVRLSQWSETIDLLQDHWLLGAGLSGYPTALEPYHQATHLEIFQYPHNIVLNIWVELGLLGLIVFAILTFRVLSTVYRLPSTPIAFLALLQMSINGLVDVPYFKNDLAILTWILLAIVFASYARPACTVTKQ